MLRSNIIGTFVAAAALGAGTAHAEEPAWQDLDPPAVTLISAGEEPRQPLRYVVSAGVTQTVRRVQGYEIAAKLPLGGSQADEGQIAMTFDVRTLAPSGEAPIEAEVTLAELTGPRGAGEGLQGSGRLRFDARGRAVQAMWDAVPTAASMDAVMLQRFQTRAAGIATPLPEEAIGKGGRWRVRQAVEQGGGRFVMVAECTLVAYTDLGWDIECRFTHETDGTSFTVGKGKRSREVKLEDSQVDGRAMILQSEYALAPLREDGDLRTFVGAKTRMGLMKVKIKVDTAERWNQVGSQ
ncbi:MAG: hypothetical protein KDA24_11870 [Deltaproteobacteria bacterium]|nr:hypothetical protein [Deltaproteobacteria bacterium]